jgi:iron complex outermembrane recepter protein
MHLRSDLHRFIAPFALFALCSAASSDFLTAAESATHATASIAGNVSNASTGNLLQGAQVEIPALGLSALTDATGRFVLSGVSAGTHAISVSYLGLDTIKIEIVVANGQSSIRNFDLTAAAYKLDAFHVSGEREGSAAAITAQRNAPNVTNVVAMDTFGNLPNMNASELAIRLPGVAGNLNLEDGIGGFTIRGMGNGLNSITVDGGMISSHGGMARTTRINDLTGAMFDQLELTKGHRPDKGADSLGGTINLKSRSPLGMREKRRITYNASMRWAPPFFEHTPIREQHRAHPMLNLGYQEVFSIAGADRNLGVSVNLFYSENVAALNSSTFDYADTLAGPAYVWDYRTADLYNNRKQASINAKLHYRFSPTTTFTLNTIYNDANERGKTTYDTRAFTAQTVGTSGSAGILPGYTEQVTQVRAMANSIIDVSVTGPNNYFVRTRLIDFGGEHKYDRWQFDYNGSFSRTHINNGNGKAGSLTNRISNVGWILDRTYSDRFPRFIQTEGADIRNANNYRPNGFLGNVDQQDNHQVREARGNALYRLPIQTDLSLKTGFMWRQQRAPDATQSRRWRYTGTGALPSDPTVIPYDLVKTGRLLPVWKSSMFMQDRVPTDASLWSEDLYYREMVKYTGTRGVIEDVTAGYFMGQGRVGHTGWLTGVRVERTDTRSWGWVRPLRPSTAAEQLSNPIGSAQRDYGDRYRELEGSYTKPFPSAHLNHDLTRNMKARLSWSTSFGRPSMTNLLPNETFNDGAQTLTINNPSLKPQEATNWDASLDYYFEPVGNLSIGWFHKTISDYIVSGTILGTVGTGVDNGYNGQYPGYSLRTSTNGGTAVAQGWEASYRQQMNFLPGPLRGLALGANYTLLNTHRQLAREITRYTDEVPGFVPRTGNINLFWRYRSLSATVLWNYTGSYITNFATSGARNRYLEARKTVNAGIAYQLRPHLSFGCDITNVFNAGQISYRGIPSRLERANFVGTTITFGMNGRF